jgi:DNA-binding XRE family transcriptional regulator
MNPLETLADKLTKRFPDAITTIDPPGVANGSWWLDVDLKGHAVAIEWRPGKGFGVSTNASDGYGEGPDEVYPTDEAAFQRVSELLTARQRTLPPRALLLKSLREAKQLSQEQLAQLLRVRQASISKMEHRLDMRISTLRNIIVGMGGELEIRACFPDGVVRIVQFDTTENRATPALPPVPPTKNIA